MAGKLTNDCAAAKFSFEDTDCDPNQNVTATAKAAISKDKNGKYVFESKMQMAGGIFDSSLLKDLLKLNQYNYTLYSPITTSEITTGNITTKGTTGRNVKEKTEDPGATYTFDLQQDGKILHTMTKTVPMQNLKVYLLLNREGGGGNKFRS